jgi:hypothetical protein
VNKHNGSFAFIMAITPCVVLGCQSAERVRGPADEAAAMELAYCTADFRDAAVARVLDGSTVERVEPVYQGWASRGSNPRLQGAAIVVRPVQGETAEWLNRALECHGAHQLVSHAKGASVQADPFWLADSLVNIEVTSTRDGFRIQVTGESSADAREILARAQGMTRPENRTAAIDPR